MSILHLCNTHFEWELAHLLPMSLEESLAQNPIFLQLQFLPFAYANEGEGILVSQVPEGETPFPLYQYGDRPPFTQLSTWGYSLLAKKWADRLSIDYPMPPWEVVKMVNAKTFSFSHSPLPDSHLIFLGDPIPKNTVLKSCYGTAGRGIVPGDSPKAENFCKEQWQQNLPVIAEPWVERVVDFSTQWEITMEKEIRFLGITFCTTSKTGVHKSNIVGDTEREKAFAPFIIEQKEIAEEVLKEMAEMGYFGEVGFDAFVYNQDKLQPICEINARKTMGWVALQVQRKISPEKTLELFYAKSEEQGPLPKKLGETSFRNQLTWSIR